MKQLQEAACLHVSITEIPLNGSLAQHQSCSYTVNLSFLGQDIYPFQCNLSGNTTPPPEILPQKVRKVAKK